MFSISRSITSRFPKTHERSIRFQDWKLFAAQEKNAFSDLSIYKFNYYYYCMMFEWWVKIVCIHYVGREKIVKIMNKNVYIGLDRLPKTILLSVFKFGNKKCEPLCAGTQITKFSKKEKYFFKRKHGWFINDADTSIFIPFHFIH